MPSEGEMRMMNEQQLRAALLTMTAEEKRAAMSYPLNAAFMDRLAADVVAIDAAEARWPSRPWSIQAERVRRALVAAAQASGLPAPVTFQYIEGMQFNDIILGQSSVVRPGLGVFHEMAANGLVEVIDRKRTGHALPTGYALFYLTPVGMGTEKHGVRGWLRQNRDPIIVALVTGLILVVIAAIIAAFS